MSSRRTTERSEIEMASAEMEPPCAVAACSDGGQADQVAHRLARGPGATVSAPRSTRQDRRLECRNGAGFSSASSSSSAPSAIGSSKPSGPSNGSGRPYTDTQYEDGPGDPDSRADCREDDELKFIGETRCRRFRAGLLPAYCKKLLNWGCRVFCRNSIITLVTKLFGPVWVYFALVLILEVVVVYFAFALRLSDHSLLFQVIQTIIGIFILTNILISYFQAVTIDPGLPPTYEEVQASIEDGTFLARYSFDLPMVVCSKCSRIKAPRTHHCSICMRCVIRMDHHCPWLNQCVGFYNYRPFFLFLFWLFVGSTFAAFSISPIVIPSLLFKVPWPLSHISYSEELSLMAALLSMAIAVASLILFGFHLFLVSMNQTTLETQIPASNSNKYNISLWVNMRQVLGPAKFPLCLLPWCEGPNFSAGNSIKFPRVANP